MTGRKIEVKKKRAFGMTTTVLSGALLMSAAQTFAQNIEDLPIDAATPSKAATPSVPKAPSNSVASGEMIMVPRAIWEKLLKDVEDLKKKNGGAPSVIPSPATTETPPPLEAPNTNSGGAQPSGTGSRNYLLLPDISFILQAKGLFGSDKRDAARRRLNLDEGELAIQGYVYPGIKVDTFITAAPAEDEPFQIEEGYLTFLGLKKGLSLNVGRKFAPFGRTGETHNHSWLYPRQLLPIQNLVSPEALVGDGVNLHYLLPLKGKNFVRASFGSFTGQGSSTQINASNPGDPFFGEVPHGTGAGFNDRFYNGRVWIGRPLGEKAELDGGFSYAQGPSTLGLDNGANSVGRVKLYGADLTYRRYLQDNKRLLLRSEYFKYKPFGGLLTKSADGYYGLVNYRLDKFNDVGLLYENSGFPQAPGVRENASSLIYTKQFTEQFYLRLMGTHGQRGAQSYNELRLQFTAGIGPHTHNLE